MDKRIKLKVLLVEDEHWARKLMIQHIKSRPDLTLSSQVNDGREALKDIRAKTYDLVFLDINLPSLSGFEIIKRLKKSPYIIFTTVSKKHALDAYDVGAVDYLVKPIDKNRFNAAVDKAIQFINGKSPRNPERPKNPELEEKIREEKKKEYLFSALQEQFGLTYQETSICLKIYEGLDREQLMKYFVIKPVTLKFHLKSIYAKTIEYSGNMSITTHGKLQLLTTYLYKLSKQINKK
jgi:DNA-binding NarL/FixJ family response regulator